MAKQKMLNMDKKEQKDELEEVVEADNVNEESKAAMADMLADKMAKQKMDNQAAAAEAAELKKVAEADLVNEDSKEVVQMSGKMQQQKMMNMDKKEKVPTAWPLV
eukprot:TRINITY_DN153_c0_g1_i4.p2 TRINITY_DN153_c0_g1~~TRINITY_DN153_c0_g1_i4.p2  ORF type:complete len:117 (+),score=66.15 TRINITY_DN153_c0_g1_i4:37-351(+)